MGIIRKDNNYTARISVTSMNGISHAVDAISWACQHWGDPECNSGNSCWNVDAYDGYFIFSFKNQEDCTLFYLTHCG